MQNIRYYPLSTKRIGRIIYLLFYFVSGLAIVLFPFVFKTLAISGIFKYFYIVWGSLLCVISVLFFIPHFYKRVYIAINVDGIFYRTHFWGKSKTFLWKDISTIKIRENFIDIYNIESKVNSLSTKSIDPEVKETLISAIQENASR